MQPNDRDFLLRIGSRTHVGKVRDENQDRLARFECPLGQVIMVADGVGGRKGGATAAEMTCRGFEEYLQNISPEADPQAALKAAANRVCQEVYERAHSGDEAVEGMGSTVVLILVQGKIFITAHAGDSRAYLYREGYLHRLTNDHTNAYELIARGNITEQEAEDHPESHILTRAIGKAPDVELEVSAPRPLEAGVTLLLCSDGLCGYVSDEAIANVMGEGTESEVADRLIALALNAGGHDNIAVQVLKVTEKKDGPYLSLEPAPEPVPTNPREVPVESTPTPSSPPHPDSERQEVATRPSLAATAAPGPVQSMPPMTRPQSVSGSRSIYAFVVAAFLAGLLLGFIVGAILASHYKLAPKTGSPPPMQSNQKRTATEALKPKRPKTSSTPVGGAQKTGKTDPQAPPGDSHRGKSSSKEKGASAAAQTTSTVGNPNPTGEEQ